MWEHFRVTLIAAWRALPGYLLLCFQKLIPPQSWPVEGLCLSLRKNVPERQCSGRKDVGLAVWTDLGRCAALSLRGRVTLGKTPILSGPLCPRLQNGDTASPFPLVSAGWLPTPKEHGLASSGGGRAVLFY